MIVFLFSTILVTTSYFVVALPRTYATRSLDNFAPQTSSIFPNLDVPRNVITSYQDSNPYDTGKKYLSQETLNLKKYPTPWTKPDINHPEVQAAIKSIDWNFVPNSKIREKYSGDLDFSHYNEQQDLDCWWSASNCVKPKISYLPPDLYTCPYNQSEWGLTFDDGPFNVLDKDDEDAFNENPYAEPELYNFLADYIGSNVVTYPAAARRALNDGHSICSHGWQHSLMTTLSNEEAVAEFYWSLRAIKEATGVTTKCWRPPQGDVDNRIRAIAWQMGMRTILWDKDTKDWAMPAPGGGDLSPAKVDDKFSEWIYQQKQDMQNHGTIVLQHELNSATVKTAEKWIPRIQQVFKVVSPLACNDITQPYWETDFQYPSIH